MARKIIASYLVTVWLALCFSDCKGEICQNVESKRTENMPRAFGCPRLSDDKESLFCCGNLTTSTYCCNNESLSVYAHDPVIADNRNTMIGRVVVLIYGLIVIVLVVLDLKSFKQRQTEKPSSPSKQQ